MARLYTPNPDGYSGDEDNGQTSAWYVFSAMGFYPVCPGSNQYVLGSPLFDKVTLHLSNGKQVIVQAANNGPSHVYVEQVMLDNKILNRTYVTHQELVKGCRVHFTMSDEPNTKRGIDESAYPYSMSLDSSVKLKTN
jgi:Putative alpha-1,2-mannosidase